MDCVLVERDVCHVRMSHDPQEVRVEDLHEQGNAHNALRLGCVAADRVEQLEDQLRLRVEEGGHGLEGVGHERAVNARVEARHRPLHRVVV